MAIQDSFNLNNALTSQSYAYKCWYNYNYGNNTMGISASDMGEITQTWSGELTNWRATASDDENAYEIEDDDFSSAKASGKSTAQDQTGYEGGGKGKMATRSAVDVVAGAGGAVFTSGVLNGALSGLSSGVTAGMANATASVLGKNAINAKAHSTSSGSWIVGAPLSLATGTAYMAKKPNKDQKEACDALQNEMTNSQNALYSAQEDMSTMSDEIVELTDEANSYNEDTNETIAENKAEYDTYQASYEALMEKVRSGQTLTEDEKSLLKELVPIMQELGVTITETSEDTTDVVSEIFDEMGTYQEGYDNAAATMAEVEGVTDYAESFDEATRANCYAEGVAQGLNAASGTTAAVKAGSFAASGGIFTAWAWGFAAMGAAGAAMSGTGTAQQLKWAGEVGTEIDMRRATQDLNASSLEVYDESVDGYEGNMTIVEDMEMLIPEDLAEMQEEMEIPEEAPQIPLGSEEQATSSGGLGLAPASTDDSGSGASGSSGLGLGLGGVSEDDKNKEKK